MLPSNLYRYCANNPVNLTDPDGLDAYPLPNGGGYYYGLRPGLDPYVLAGVRNNWVYNDTPGRNYSRQCATGGQFLAGGLWHGAIHDVPSTPTWRQGAAVGADTQWGTLIATGWQGGKYPSLTLEKYQATYPGSPTNHVGIFLGYADGKIVILDQSTGRPLTIEQKDAAGWNVVKVPNSKDGPYEDAASQSYMKATRSPARLAAIQRYGPAAARLIYGSIDGLSYIGSIDGFQGWNGLGDLPVGGASPSNTEATAQR